MNTPSEKTMSAVIHRLGDRLAQAQSDRVGALMDLMARNMERGKVPAVIAVGLEAVEACAQDPRRRSDVLCAMGRALVEAEAYEMAGELAARAIHDAVACHDIALAARARELQGTLLMRRRQYQAAREEFRIAGL